MPNLFAGINLALRAVLAHQQAMQVVEHNVANANTPGYRRQKAMLTAGLPYAPPSMNRSTYPGQMGQGVMVDNIRRFNLEFFDDRYRKELSDAKRWDASQSVLTQVEATMAETTPDGLTNKLDEFWSGWQTLSTDPTNTALRGDLRERASSLVAGFNRRAQDLIALRTDQDLAVQQHVADINTAAQQVARLNTEIARVKSVGDEPNDLLDERDRALDRLAELTGATSYTEANGQANVSINGHALVVGNTTFALATSPNLANANLAQIAWADGLAFSASRGELAGLLDARDRVIPNQQAWLDATASAVMNAVNALHQTGFGLPPANATGLAFFTGTDALSMRLSANITDPVNGLSNIAAASAVNAPGDGNNAAAMATLQTQLLMNGGTATINQYYTSQTGALALELHTAQASANDRQLVADSLNQQRESIGGVSLDEEAAQLVQSQRAYEAATRLMTTVDDMLDRVINGMGRVGL